MNCKSRFFLNLHYTAYVLVLTFLDICIRGLKIFSALIHTVKTKKSCSKDAECLKQFIFKFNKPELENLGLFFFVKNLYYHFSSLAQVYRLCHLEYSHLTRNVEQRQ